MNARQIEADSKQIFEALAHGITGDDEAAMSMIRPIVRRSDAAMYATFCSLAESASFDARQQPEAGDHFVLEVENIETGQEGSVDALPPGVRFAAQFVTAWANRDRETAEALYLALYKSSPEDLGVGLRSIYEMAVVSLRTMVERRRAGGVA